jgi:hypothetical protein
MPNGYAGSSPGSKGQVMAFRVPFERLIGLDTPARDAARVFAEAFRPPTRGGRGQSERGTEGGSDE